MQITWTNCADEMPDNNSTHIILNDGGTCYVFEWYMLHICWMKEVAVSHRHSWTIYTPEKWKELNK